MNVVITGASAGVGRATARAFAARGAGVGLLARNREALENARREVEARGGKAYVVVCDVADAEAVERAAEECERELGAIDVWVNNAMVSVFGPVREITAAEFRRVTEVTYLGVVHGTLAALRHMLPRDRGVIIQVGSSLAYRGIPLQAPYCAAKHAIQGFHDALRPELMHEGSGVHTCMVHFPALNTPQFRWSRSHMPFKPRPFGTIFEPEVAAQAIVWLAEHPRRELNVSWGTSQAIIANAFFPGALDRYLARVGWNQQDKEPDQPDRPHNLYEPVPGDAGAHGPFSGEAKSASPALVTSEHRGAVLGALAAAGLIWLLARK